MKKNQIIVKLKGKTITTADGVTHVVQDGRFETADSTTMRLENLHMAHLRRFLKDAKEKQMTEVKEINNKCRSCTTYLKGQCDGQEDCPECCMAVQIDRHGQEYCPECNKYIADMQCYNVTS